MRKLYRWNLVDREGKVIATGRKKEIEMKAYHRYVYERIFDDVLINTKKDLMLS